ncbi:MAG: hybrid sensor histidine kinase/response regulator [bacterium]|nr:hybrid sensor histidine kinase/response regulator [bacterium]
MSSDNRRILLVDDSPSIHEDFRKILEGDNSSKAELGDAKAAFFGEESPTDDDLPTFELDSAHQGQEGLEMLETAIEEGRPYAMAFVDVRMPPGWDGIQTIKHMWEAAPELHVVICTAYSDYSWDQTIRELGQSERLLILKKPFDAVEIRQLAHALTDKVNSSNRERLLMAELKQAEAEARSYAASVETMNQALKTAKATADKASEMKSEFLLHLSQQVNTNLTTILARVDQLEAIEGLDVVLDSSRQLMRALSEIFDITQIESGNIEIDSGPCKIFEVVQEVVLVHAEQARVKGLWLEVGLPEAIPEIVETDEQRFRQVLSELVENALHNTSTGGVQVTVTMTPTNDWQHSIICCDVIDTGRGVPDEMHGKLFEPFAGAGKIGTRGPGLGLALAKQIARMLGGDIVHEHNTDRGSTFHLTLHVGNMSGVRMVGGQDRSDP